MLEVISSYRENKVAALSLGLRSIMKDPRCYPFVPEHPEEETFFFFNEFATLSRQTDMGIPDHLTCLLKILYMDQEATVKTLHGTMEQTGSKLRKECDKAVYCHPTYLTYMQSTSCKMPDWLKGNLESRLPKEISTTSDM